MCASGPFGVSLDISDLASLGGLVIKPQDKRVKDAVAKLTAHLYGHIVEEAGKKLHARRQMFVDALSWSEDPSGQFYVITLDGSARWIEDGTPSRNLIDDLLKSPKAKTAADGCVLNPRNKVMTSTGWKRIKDILPGDMVLTHSGKFREVKKLLVTETPLGTKYVIIHPLTIHRNFPVSEYNELCAPSLSLTEDHPVLTPSGWVRAGDLKRGDLIATPTDKTRLCQICGAPLFVNTTKTIYCANNRCARIAGFRAGKMLARRTKEQRSESSRQGSDRVREMGYFDKPDWGCRNPDHLRKMRLATTKAQRTLSSSGKWGPEEQFEKMLIEYGIKYERELPIRTERIVLASRGKYRKSVLFCDFFLPDLNTVVELDGKYWHAMADAIERDRAKDAAIAKRGWNLIRLPSNEIYGKRGQDLIQGLVMLGKNHSGDLGVGWAKVDKIQSGVLTRKDHVYAKKYDICLEADEHSFCCETVFIHNSKYMSIPFSHKGGATQNSPAQMQIIAAVRGALKGAGIPYQKIERDKNGAPLLGLLHKLDITNAPIKTNFWTGQGSGPVGQVMQGWSQNGQSGTALLQGLRIYQKMGKGKKGEDIVKRGIVTFRTVSSKQKGQQGRWDHPGNMPVHILDEAVDWAHKQWAEIIGPELLVALIG